MSQIPGIIWTMAASLGFLLAICVCVFWVYQSVKLSEKFAKYLKSLLYLNWAAIGVFTLTTFFVFLECILNVAKGINFSTEFEQQDIQLNLLIAILFYLIGKYMVYFILYLRLYYTLQKSAYRYNDKTYNTIKYLIFFEILLGIIALVGFTTAKDDEDYIGIIAAGIYFILDIGIPVSLNVMFIKKTYEIGRAYFVMVSMTAKSSQHSIPRPSVPQPTLSDNASNKSTDKSSNDKSSNDDQSQSGQNHGTQQQQQQQRQRVSQLTTPDTKSFNPSLQNHESNTTTNNKSMSMRSSSVGSHGSHASHASQNSAENGNYDNSNNNNENSRELEELFETISKVAILSIIIAVSSISFFIVWGICINFQASYPMIWLMLTVDSCFNMVCLIFAFDFAKKLYHMFCSCCQNCCSNCVQKQSQNSV